MNSCQLPLRVGRQWASAKPNSQQSTPQAQGNVGQGRNHRARPSRNCATGTTQTPTASGSFRETGTVPSEPTRVARVSSTPFALARSKCHPHKQRSRQQSEKRHVNRLRRYSHLARLKKARDNAAPCCITQGGAGTRPTDAEICTHAPQPNFARRRHAEEPF